MTLPDYAMGSASFPEMYERWLVTPLFRPFARVILEEVALTTGDRLLDIACGTGVVARLANEQLGNDSIVVGIDASPQMLGVARDVAPAIDWREGDASALPLLDGEQFDVVICHQGLQFFPDKATAAREMRRALAAGGRLAVATWRTNEEIPLMGGMHRVAERHLGTFVDRRHCFGESGPLEALFRDAGFGDVRVRTLSREVRFDDAGAFVHLNAMALVGMSPAAKEMSDEDRKSAVATIVRDSATVVAPYLDGKALVFEISSSVTTVGLTKK